MSNITRNVRPMHFFGSIGLGAVGLGGAILSFLVVDKFRGHEIVGEHAPLVFLGGLMLLAGLMMFSTGLIGEVVIRTYFESQDRRIYAVREVRSRKARGVAGNTR
jgi:hypothetical protein